MSDTSLILRYVAFAIMATAANLATQRLVLHIENGPHTYYAGLLAGTLAGLIIKYILDKRWIFADTTTGLQAHGRKFSLYSLTGVATTAIFWGTETAFWLNWGTDFARELGAILGLSVGYLAKYHLDRRYVFVSEARAGRVA